VKKPPYSATADCPAVLLRLEEALVLAERRQSVEEVGGSELPVMAVDLRSADRSFVAENRDHRLIAAMVAAPWVNIAVVGPNLDVTLAPLADAFDVLIGDHSGANVAIDVDDVDGAVAELTRCVAASPQASVALVQLLRLSDGISIEQALHAESMTYAVLQTGEVFLDWLGGRAAKPPPANPDAAVLLDRTGSLLNVTLNRPDRRNALSIDMRDALAEALALIEDDPSLDGAILRGAGDNFSSGGDLDEFGSTPSPAVGHQVRTLRSLPRLINRVADRVRVHVHGACVGAGIELPAFADAVIAHPDSTFRLPEIGFGLVPGAGGTVSVTRRCGRHRTAWLALTGTTIDALTARQWQLIDRIDSTVFDGSGPVFD
jgi:enoyl-CoA hydratase/carnithine racemase